MITSLVSIPIFAGVIVFLLTLLLSYRINLRDSFVSSLQAMFLLTIILLSLWCIKYSALSVTGDDKFIVSVFAIVSLLFYIAIFWDMFHEHNEDIHASLIFPLAMLAIVLFAISLLIGFASWIFYATANLP